MDIDHDRISFTYWLRWKCGTKYYGVRHGKGCHYFDLGTKYKSSSKHVKAFIKEHGEPEYKVDRIFLNAMEAVAYEHEVLKSHDAKNNSEFLNRCNGAEKWTNEGGYKLTEETKQKLRGPKSEEHKRNLSKAGKGKPHTEERKRNMRGPRSIVQCPHCLKSGGISNMKRYHFNNCKRKAACH